MMSGDYRAGGVFDLSAATAGGLLSGRRSLGFGDSLRSGHLPELSPWRLALCPRLRSSGRLNSVPAGSNTRRKATREMI
jgi:hypothetical protein